MNIVLPSVYVDLTDVENFTSEPKCLCTSTVIMDCIKNDQMF